MALLATIDKTRKEFKFDDLIVSLDDAKEIGKFIEIECDLLDDAVFNKDEVTAGMIEKLQGAGVLKNFKKVNIGYVELYLKKHNRAAYEVGLYKDE